VRLLGSDGGSPFGWQPTMPKASTTGSLTPAFPSFSRLRVDRLGFNSPFQIQTDTP
jgi:hypothetical protein